MSQRRRPWAVCIGSRSATRTTADDAVLDREGREPRPGYPRAMSRLAGNPFLAVVAAGKMDDHRLAPVLCPEGTPLRLTGHEMAPS